MYQKRYIAYAKAHGKTPDEMLDHDNHHMVNYMLWLGNGVVEYRQENPDAFTGSRLVDHDGFDRYLEDYSGDEHDQLA